MIITIDTFHNIASAKIEYNGALIYATITITPETTIDEIESRLTDELSENVLNAASPLM